MSADNAIITATLEWEGRAIRLSYHPRKWDVIDHLEIESETREPLPITETGYLSQFFGPMEPALTIDEVIETVRDHLDTAARDPDWIKVEAERRQRDLF